ncbi:MAG: FAD:protein FMN transferase [Rhizobacter sp.]|nr:FAD:protein FMN transferase [Rhizobacter sp.]
MATPLLPGASAASALSRREALVAGAGVLLWPALVDAQGPPVVHQRPFLFGSPAEVLHRADAGELATRAVPRLFSGLQQMNDRWNAWKPGELRTLNLALRAGRTLQITPSLTALIQAATRLERASSGMFNPGIGGAVGRWGFHDDVMQAGSRPRDADLAPWRAAAPSLSQLEWRGNELRSRNPYLQLDFGAYAKGVAVDWALDFLRTQGVADAVVNLGGNLAAMGRAGARGWRIGIRDPGAAGLLASLTTHGREAVVTSGSYERYRVLDGERCTHILDPSTVAPAGQLVSVTVVHRSAGLADAAATALLVAGPRRWRQVAEGMGVSEVLLIGRDLRGEVTASLAPRLRFADPAWQARVGVV